MSDRAEFEKWREGAILRGKKDFTDMDWHLCWLGWQAARAQSGQGAKPVGFATDKHLEQSLTYFPCKRVPDGNWSIPLYTHPQPAQQVVNISAGIWDEMNRVLGVTMNRGNGRED